MHIAFAIVSLFPGGGLQRDCVDIARRIQKFGHEVIIFTSRLSGNEFAKDLPLRILNVSDTTNHGRQREFSEQFFKAASGKFDLIVGFDKLSGLDMLYCSDQSMYARTRRNRLLGLLPRYREYNRLEKESFAPKQKTNILLLSEYQRNEYWSAWKTEPSRMIMLPPTLVQKRCRPEYRTDGTREKSRAHLGLLPNDWVWIAVCVQPHTKGVDRTVKALCHFPEARLLIVGLDEVSRRAEKIRRLAQRLRVSRRIMWLGHCEDIPELMSAADLFIHPARYDTTGTVILEAIVNGLPVITTSVCGYSSHVSNAEAGIVIQEPFRKKTLIAALETAQDPSFRTRWSVSGSEYGKHRSLYEGRMRAAKLIIEKALENGELAKKIEAQAS